MNSPKQPYMIVFDLIDGSRSDYEAIYCSVHASGGYHYVRDHDSWGRLPQRTVVIPLAAGWNAACARVAFELLLAKLGLMASSIAVIAGEPAVELATLNVTPPLFLGVLESLEVSPGPATGTHRATGTHN